MKNPLNPGGLEASNFQGRSSASSTKKKTIQKNDEESNSRMHSARPRAYDIKPPFHHHRILCRRFYLAPFPQRSLSGSRQNDSSALVKRSYGHEEINLYVMRLAQQYDDDDVIDQLFLHVDVSKPGQKNSMRFLCGLYPDAMGIHFVSLRPKCADGVSII
ncbi:hypothetical protein Dsin_000438 [Dipteronia sinensis]|uniref:Uncharacterized protein n=1 Tax=Dipteronia sinensis TaxID=43782 RepID=A0AAE0B2D1_9ROSI|nr:hypothetical protein Dsin_000438 [Dipteronia sinensis]